MEEGDEVEFNNLVPSYLTKGLSNETHVIGFIDNDGWVFLKDDTRNPKKMFHQKWLRVVR